MPNHTISDDFNVAINCDSQDACIVVTPFLSVPRERRARIVEELIQILDMATDEWDIDLE